MYGERFESFIEALWFDSAMTSHFTRTEIESKKDLVVSPKQIATLMLRSGAFRNALLSNDLIYYKGHLYSPDAFTFEDDSIHLSADAKAYPEKYCLAIQPVQYEGTELYLNPEPLFDILHQDTIPYRMYRQYGGMNPAFIFAPGPDFKEKFDHPKPKKVEWKSHIYSVPEKGNQENKFDRRSFETYMDKIRNLPDDFGSTLKEFIKDSNRSQEDVAFDANISARNLTRLISNKQQPKLETVIALCIALHLFPLFSDYLIKTAGYSLRNTESGIAYKILINQFYTEDIDFCNSFLRRIGVEPLTYDPLSEMR